MQVHADFETRSLLSVKDCGGYTYSRHPSTDVMCLAYAVDDDPINCLSELSGYAPDGAPMRKLRQLAGDPSIIFAAHNAFFEQCIWKNIMVPRYGMPEIPIHRWRCTAAKAASMSLPRDLEGVCKALNSPFGKDMAGNKVMLKLSRPRRLKSGLVFWTPDDAPEDFEHLYKYCIADVEAERWVDKNLPDLSEREQKLWFLDQEINFRGVQLDVPAINQVLSFIDITTTKLTEEFQEMTGLNGPSQVVKFREWLSENGCDLPNLQAPTVDKRLAGGFLDSDDCIRALEIRRALSKISTAKYTAMLNRVDTEDNRLRDILMYYAAITGRWGGRGVQIQNLPRGTVNSDTCLQHIMLGDYAWFDGCYSDPMAAYSSCLRGVLTAAPGHDLFVGDFSSIEARVVAWLAGQTQTLDIFREGRDIYCEEASTTFGRSVTKADKYERSVGKVEVLALGYGGGIGAFGAMARAYGVTLVPAYDYLWDRATEDEKTKARKSYNSYLTRAEKAENPDPLDRASGYAADVIKQRWRRRNAAIVDYWSRVEEAAINAVLTGQKQPVPPYVTEDENGWAVVEDIPNVIFGMYGETLLCQLPSGNCIKYPFARVAVKETPWGQEKYTLSYKVSDEKTWQFGRKWTYGGALVENITQAVARDALAAALIRLAEAGYPIAFHCHDEAVADVPRINPEADAINLEYYLDLMAVVPEWAEGLPIEVEGWKGHRYRK
jgi:DNA polymerase bacteriophage-type